MVPLSVCGARQLPRRVCRLASCRPLHSLRLPLTPPPAAGKLAAGIEPVRFLRRGILSSLCLPVPPQRLIEFLRTCGPWCRCPFAVPGSRYAYRLAPCRPLHTLRLPLYPPPAAGKLAAGIEPVRFLRRGILSPLCLPVPPQRRVAQYYHTLPPSSSRGEHCSPAERETDRHGPMALTMTGVGRSCKKGGHGSDRLKSFG